MRRARACSSRYLLLLRGRRGRVLLPGPARIGEGSQDPLQFPPAMLKFRRERERLAQAGERLVRGETRSDGRDLEQDSPRLPEVDRPEIEAVDDRGRASPALNHPLTPGGVIVH